MVYTSGEAALLGFMLALGLLSEDNDPLLIPADVALTWPRLGGGRNPFDGLSPEFIARFLRTGADAVEAVEPAAAERGRRLADALQARA